MKHFSFKILSVIICLAMLLPFASMNASAAEGEYVFVMGPQHSLLQFPVDDAYFPEEESNAGTVNRFYSNSSAPFTFFSQLTTPQKRIYNALLNSRMGLDSPDFIYGGDVWGREVDVPFSDFKFASSSYDTLMSNIDKNVVMAISSLMEDYPEFFWLGGYGYGMTLGYENGQYVLGTLVLILMPNPLAYEANGWDAIEEDYSLLTEKINSFEIEGSTRYEKLLSIHDAMCRIADYDFTFVLPHAYDPLGIFVDPYDFVCEGYSEAFKLLCDREGIPCICIVGEGGYGDNTGGHKWNYVQMEDGKWYGVDVTWDDQDEIMHDYFLVGSQTRSEYFGHHMFSEEHVPSGALFMGIIYRLSYPTLSETRYYSQSNSNLSLDGSWRYKVLDDGTASICSGVCEVPAYVGSEADVTVPAEIDGYTVSALGTSAFAHCETLNSVSVPDTVSSIGRFAFEDCSAKTVVLPEGITDITYGAFINSGLTAITLPASVETIGLQAFEGSASLESISFNSDISEIGNFAFNGCASLKSIEINGSFTAIGEKVFAGCASLESCILPDSVTEIGANAFDGCASLTEFDFSNIQSIGRLAFNGCASFTDIEIPETVSVIETRAFGECEKLENVKLPDTLEKISDAAFYKCYALESILIPESVTEISKSAFLKSGLKKIYGYEGSYAEEYADTYGYKFIPLDENGIPYEGFPDVVKSDWYYGSVKYCSQKGYITGYKDGTFGPVNNLTRQDFVVILARIDGADLSKYKTCKLKDVDMNSYYGPSVAWAVDEGIITGYNNGYFGVGDSITREQVATILYRYKGSPAVSASDRKLLNAYTDKGNISSFAVDAMAWAVKNGVLSGKNATTLAPVNTAVRAEIAKIVMNMDEKGLL